MTESATDSTRSRLLDTAMEVFAEKGFDAASVRDICKQAGANIAAVNYYFGDKERLYIEAVKNAHCCSTEGPPPEWPAEWSAKDRLHGFIRMLTERMLGEKKPGATQLMMREMVHPTAACFEVVREYIRPMADILQGILKELTPEISTEDRYLMGFSIVGQVLFYKTNRPIARQIMGEEAFDRLDAERLARHVFEFTLRGIGLTASDMPRSTLVPS